MQFKQLLKLFFISIIYNAESIQCNEINEELFTKKIIIKRQLPSNPTQNADEVIDLSTVPFQGTHTFENLISEKHAAGLPFVLKRVSLNIPGKPSSLQYVPAIEYKENPSNSILFEYYQLNPQDTAFTRLDSPTDTYIRAAAGDQKKQLELGGMLCMKKEWDKSFFWLEKAAKIAPHTDAEQHNFEALVILEKLYFSRSHSPQLSQEEKADCLKKASEYEKLAKPLERSYKESHLAPTSNLKTALQKTSDYIKRLRMKAESNDIAAQETLADYYKCGTYGIEKNCDSALFWYKKAAKSGSITALSNIAILYLEDETVINKKGVVVNPKRAEKAVDALRKAAALGYAPANDLLAHLYIQGTGVEKNIEKAFQIFTESAAKGDNPQAQFNLGVMYEYGKGVAQDKEMAVKYYKAAIQSDTIDSALSNAAKLRLAYHYVNGKNYREAFALLKNALEFSPSHTEALIHLAYLYEHGLGTEQDHVKAFTLYLQTAQERMSFAQYKAGLFYEKGIGTASNINEAKRFYGYAAKKGVIEAQYALARLQEEQNQKDPSLQNESSPLQAITTEACNSSQPTPTSENVYTQLSYNEKIKKLVDDFNKSVETATSRVSLTPSQFEKGEVIITDEGGAIITLQLGKGVLKLDKGLAPKVDLMYAGRVKDFLSQPEKALQSRGLLSQGESVEDVDPGYQSFLLEQTERHAFDKTVDRFLQIYGKPGTYTDTRGRTINNKILKGSLQLSNGKKLEGYYVYGCDDTGVIFHRYFECDKNNDR